MNPADRLAQKVAEYKEDMVKAQEALVEIVALGPDNGGAGEWEKARLVEGWFRDMGLAITRVDSPDQRVPGGLRPNLIGTLAGGDGPAVWVLSHLDVVPAGEAALWGGDPFKLRRDGDTIYGRGVSDNHQGMVSSIFAARALMDLGITPPGPVGLVVVADEETGSGHGLEYVLKTRPDLFGSDDLIIVPDAGAPDGGFIEVAEKSILWMRVEVTGKQVHGSIPHTGVNALYAAARMMVAVREIRDGLAGHDELFVPPTSTCEPTRKEAGVSNINTVPGKDVFYVDCRLLPTLNVEEVLGRFEKRFRQIAAEEGATVAITTPQKLQAAPATPPEAPVVAALSRAIRQVRGVEPVIGGVGGGTVAAFFRQMGLNAAVWSTEDHQAHQPDESINVNDMVADAKVMAQVMAGL